MLDIFICACAHAVWTDVLKREYICITLEHPEGAEADLDRPTQAVCVWLCVLSKNTEWSRASEAWSWFSLMSQEVTTRWDSWLAGMRITYPNILLYRTCLFKSLQSLDLLFVCVTKNHFCWTWRQEKRGKWWTSSIAISRYLNEWDSQDYKWKYYYFKSTSIICIYLTTDSHSLSLSALEFDSFLAIFSYLRQSENSASHPLLLLSISTLVLNVNTFSFPDLSLCLFLIHGSYWF